MWTLYDTPIELPLHGQAFDKDKHLPGAPSREIVLGAGDLFYCPRGLMHSARASQETSLHITLGLIGKTWADLLLEAVSAACLASPAFRANLPVGFADNNFDASTARATFRALIDSFARQAELEPMLERFAEDFVSSRRPDFGGSLMDNEAGAGIGAASRLEARPHLIYRLRHDGTAATLLFASSRLTFPAAAAEAIMIALAGKPFVVGELPGRLDQAGKIVLVNRLLREGLLRRCANAAAAAARSGPHALT